MPSRSPHRSTVRCQLAVAVLTLYQCCLHGVHSYSTGAPAFACGAMRPMHQIGPIQFQPASGDGTNSITTNIGPTYLPSTTYAVTVVSSGLAINGIFCQVRSAATPRDGTSPPIGSFTTFGNTQLVDCTGQIPGTTSSSAGITHTQRLATQSLTIPWTSPAEPAGDLLVRCTVVHTVPMFHTQIPSAVFSPASSTTTETTTTPSMTMTQTTPPVMTTAETTPPSTTMAETPPPSTTMAETPPPSTTMTQTTQAETTGIGLTTTAGTLPATTSLPLTTPELMTVATTSTTNVPMPATTVPAGMTTTLPVPTSPITVSQATDLPTTPTPGTPCPEYTAATAPDDQYIALMGCYSRLTSAWTVAFENYVRTDGQCASSSSSNGL
ncbi:uncharacterized protein LOC135808347 isoform X2 [Sycon ciliatum]|uniref:uncharacterized protein LOC135808347 isoform X2 n=1 Tax=Sycon ciliatum TaxID=27933 RepID=UPI0031F69BF9